MDRVDCLAYFLCISYILRLVAGGSSFFANESSTATVSASAVQYAESCQAALRAWSSSSLDYGSRNGHTSTSLFSSHMTVESEIPAETTVTSLVTLCDGHPRVVGRVHSSGGTTEIVEIAWTNTNPRFVLASYPTPAPCSIGPKDCELLWSSWTTHYNALSTRSGFGGLLDPPCTTSTPPPQSYSTNAAGGQCDDCLVVGHSIRLLYWPVTSTRSNLCNTSLLNPTPAPSARTFITEGITITSPSVAISIRGLSRADNCGPTVDHTIIPVPPQDVSSVEGARAAFTHRPFDFANLNYNCLEEPASIFFVSGARTDCYQAVPASAYFYGYANAAGADWYLSDAFAHSTIYPDYQPQVLPPAALKDAIRSLWGSDCFIHPDGVWDPPIALTEVNSVPLPRFGPTASTEYWTPVTTPAAAPAAATAGSAAQTGWEEGKGTVTSVAPSSATPSRAAGGLSVPPKMELTTFPNGDVSAVYVTHTTVVSQGGGGGSRNGNEGDPGRSRAGSASASAIEGGGRQASSDGVVVTVRSGDPVSAGLVTSDSITGSADPTSLVSTMAGLSDADGASKTNTGDPQSPGSSSSASAASEIAIPGLSVALAALVVPFVL